ncbi:hypothetical protein VNO77_23359 [Canavalia gladiata]|uniref:Uncharacterized protein n=1 Tax=Canavalia gladiata TaxID=3824 RepID=A0AAN9QBT1_CANGL
MELISKTPLPLTSWSRGDSPPTPHLRARQVAEGRRASPDEASSCSGAAGPVKETPLLCTMHRGPWPMVAFYVVDSGSSTSRNPAENHARHECSRVALESLRQERLPGAPGAGRVTARRELPGCPMPTGAEGGGERNPARDEGPRTSQRRRTPLCNFY